MSEPGPIAQALGRIAYEFNQLQPILPTYAHVILAALFPIYIASHASLSRPSSAAKPTKKEKTEGDSADGDDDDDDFQRMEGLSPTDALLFPLLAGVTLTGLYFLIKWLQDPELLNKILNWYFAVVGLYGVCKFISDAFHIVHLFVFPSYYSDGVNVWHVSQSTRKTARITGEGEASVSNNSFARTTGVYSTPSQVSWISLDGAGSSLKKADPEVLRPPRRRSQNTCRSLRGDGNLLWYGRNRLFQSSREAMVSYQSHGICFLLQRAPADVTYHLWHRNSRSLRPLLL